MTALSNKDRTMLDPSRINIVTVVDFTSDEIVRDTLTLLRSLRLHGGLLNNATFTAYIPIEDESALIDDSQFIQSSQSSQSSRSILLQIASLGAEISFMAQQPNGKDH
jgi:hypothetical protein